MINQRRPRAMTAVETLAAAVLSALLMTAVVGVLRGLKAQEDALAMRTTADSWERSLTRAMRADFENSHSYLLLPESLWLYGYADSEKGQRTWRPSTVVYEVRRTADRSWLVRRTIAAWPASSASGPANLVLAGVSAISVGAADEEGVRSAQTPAVAQESPLFDGLAVYFWSDDANSKPLYAYRHHAL